MGGVGFVRVVEGGKDGIGWLVLDGWIVNCVLYELLRERD